MNARTCNALKAYGQAGVETAVATASPHQLISMLFEGALLAISAAKGHLLRGDAAAKSKAILKAAAIIDAGLKASLDEKAGGDIARNLKALYEYMSGRLYAANLNDDPALLDEVARLLTGLQETWEAIGSRPAETRPLPEPAPFRVARSYGAA